MTNLSPIRLLINCFRFYTVIRLRVGRCFRNHKKQQISAAVPFRRHALNKIGDNDYSVRHMGSGMVRVDRHALIQRFLPQSQGHLAARLPVKRELPSGELFDHVIASRFLRFEEHTNTQIVSLFFSLGLKNDGLCGYQLHYVLDDKGEVIQLKENRMERSGRGFRGSPMYFRPGQVDSTTMENIINLADSFLGTFTEAVSISKLPANHRLQRPIRFETRFER